MTKETTFALVVALELAQALLLAQSSGKTLVMLLFFALVIFA